MSGFGKYYETAFEGSMVGSGLAVFAVWGYVIAKTKPPGVVELNPKLLSGILGCKVDEVVQAVEFLCSPDPDSRGKEHGGARLVKVDAFLYEVPRWSHYRGMRDEEHRRGYMREYMRARRGAAPAPGGDQTPRGDPVASNPVPVEKISAKPAEEAKSAFALPEWVPAEQWAQWMEVRAKKRAPNTAAAKKLALGRLDKLRAAGHDPKLVLEQSIARGYTGLFELKPEGGNGSANSTADTPDTWWRTEQGVAAKAAALGLTRDLRESTFAFRVRVLDEAGDGPWIDERDVTTHRHIMERRARRGTNVAP